MSCLRFWKSGPGVDESNLKERERGDEAAPSAMRQEAQEQQQTDDDDLKIPSNVATGAALCGVFGAAIGAIIDSYKMDDFAKKVEAKAQAERDSAEHQVLYGSVSQNILQ